ncbi:serine/threonine protein kinase [Aquincola tertiaricarbonis]|uniref:serine/threonine protein kinase n=1 Tax=Aquincola tertiaricarbonis TaxID=391953 RepID=UPI0012EEA58D|nr:hypothetical protein [Aquincola tertiaricarbonis]
MATPLKLAGAPPPGNEHALPPGTRVGGVVIDSVLSVGEYGIVYHAVDPMLRRAVAVKEYFAPGFCQRDDDGQVSPRTPADAARFATGRQAFIEEARLLAHLDIPGLLPVSGLFEDHGTVFRLMPYAPGRTLAAWRAMYSDTMDEGGLRHLLADLMGPLEALHAANLVHGYVLPEQVILAEGRPALLLGFGTVRRSLQGTMDAAYTPVEQLPSGGHLPRGAWSDVYALAALARFAMSAQPVAVSADPPTAHALRTRAPMGHALSHALERALAPLPGDRPQSVAALRQAMGLRPSGGLAAGMVDVTLPGGEPFDATATRPWPQPSIGAVLRSSSLRSAVAEQTATAPVRKPRAPAPATSPAPHAAPLPTPMPLPVRASSHEAALEPLPDLAARAWEDRTPAPPAAPTRPAARPFEETLLEADEATPVAARLPLPEPMPAVPVATEHQPERTAEPAPVAPSEARQAPPQPVPEPVPLPLPANESVPEAAEPAPTSSIASPPEPSLEPGQPLQASLTAGPREPAFDAPELPPLAPDEPVHDPIPQFMATAAAQELREPPLHAPTAAPAPVPAPPPEVTSAPAPVAWPAPVPDAPTPAPMRLQPIDWPAPQAGSGKPAVEADEEPIDDAVRAAIAAAIGSLPPAPPRRAPEGAMQAEGPAGQAPQRIELPDFSALSVAEPPADAASPAPARAGGWTRGRMVAAVLAMLVLLVVLGALAWSAWKDATLNLGGPGG